jgi:prevent-host-death family protein
MKTIDRRRLVHANEDVSIAVSVVILSDEAYCRLNHYFMGTNMDEPVSAADANRRFSLILRRVREGNSYVVTSHGKAVARILAADAHDETTSSARSALLSRLSKQPVVDAGSWSRNELYED